MVNVTEVWRSIPGFEGEYEVSNAGNVRSLDRQTEQLNHVGNTVIVRRRGKQLKPVLNGGYFSVSMGRDSRIYKVHKLVALAWHGERPDGLHINHINGIKTDNRPENLEYVTPKENGRHAAIHGLYRPQDGENNNCAKLTEDHVRMIRKTNGTVPCNEIARQLGVSSSAVEFVRNGVTWKHVTA